MPHKAGHCQQDADGLINDEQRTNERVRGKLEARNQMGRYGSSSRGPVNQPQNEVNRVRVIATDGRTEISHGKRESNNETAIYRLFGGELPPDTCVNMDE